MRAPTPLEACRSGMPDAKGAFAWGIGVRLCPEGRVAGRSGVGAPKSTSSPHGAKQGAAATLRAASLGRAPLRRLDGASGADPDASKRSDCPALMQVSAFCLVVFVWFNSDGLLMRVRLLFSVLGFRTGCQFAGARRSVLRGFLRLCELPSSSIRGSDARICSPENAVFRSE
jgi:hypothetical protein